MCIQPYEDAPTKSIIRHEEIVERARLMNKSYLLLRALGGLLPGLKPDHLQHMTNVLEIACGPGIWTLEVARANPQVQVTGVDTSSAMVASARNLMREQALSNVEYRHIPSFVHALPFEDMSFDFISMQFMEKFLKADEWPYLLSECWRLLRPGGLIRLTELEVSWTTSLAHEKLCQLFIQSMRLDGRSFSPSDRHLGLISELEPLLYASRFEECTSVPHMVNYSYGAPLHDEWRNDLLILSKEVESLIVEMGIATQEYVDTLHRQQHYEMSIPTFHAIQPLLTVWGIKVTN